MENHYANLFRVIFMLNFALFLSFTEVKSAPVASSIIDIMKNDSKLCPTAKFLYDSEYIKPCASMAYPTASLNLETLNNFLCLGVYDTAYKICQYSSQLQIPLNSTAMFNSYVEKYIPVDNKAQKDFCNSLQGFTSLYDKIDLLLKQLVKSLNTPRACEKICFDLEDKFHPLCAVLAWIKNNDDVISAKKIETKYDPVETDKSYIMQDETSNGKTTLIESKKTEIKEPKEQNGKQIITDSNDNNNNIVKGNSNIPDNASDIKFDEEKTKSDTEKANNIQKKINNTLEKQAHKSVLSIQENKGNTDTELDTNTAIEKSIKGIPPSDDSQDISKNKPINNINKNVNEEIAEKSNKEQNINDLKPSTLSENTQDHYDAENPEGNMENDIDDVGDTNQHPGIQVPDTGNQNENVQESFEQKNNNARLTEYSNMRTEDDSHFFIYFVIILACLAGYIGYHNKQKILAIVLEGRRSRNNRGRRRPSTASYRKLDCTLEEAVTSQCSANVTHVIY